MAAFDAIYKAGTLHHAHPSAAAEHAANAQHMARLQGSANGWEANPIASTAHDISTVRVQYRFRTANSVRHGAAWTPQTLPCYQLHSSGITGPALRMHSVDLANMWYMVVGGSRTSPVCSLAHSHMSSGPRTSSSSSSSRTGAIAPGARSGTRASRPMNGPLTLSRASLQQ